MMIKISSHFIKGDDIYSFHLKPIDTPKYTYISVILENNELLRQGLLCDYNTDLPKSHRQ